MARIKLTVIGLYGFNPELFSRMQLPEGVDQENLVMNILERSGDMPLLYPDYDFMEAMIGVWSHNELEIWQRLFDTTKLKYDPIANYDRTESITRNVSSSGSSSTTDAATAFNSNEFKDTGSSRGSSQDTGTETVTARAFGNVGVTSSQQLVLAEREVSEFNIYEYITRSFIDRFCIELY